MKASSLSPVSSNMMSIVLVILAALLVFAVLAGKKIPLISGDRVALILLVVIGMTICSKTGIGRVSAAGEWAHPLAIVGYVLGALILIVAAAGFFGIRLPLVSDARGAFLAVTILATGKLILGFLHRLL